MGPPATSLRYAGGVATTDNRQLELNALLLFAEAVECEAAHREALLDERCGNNALLRSRVLKLLAADAASETALERQQTQFDPPTRIPSGTRSATVMPPPQIGVYKLVDLIGAGGMGSVYRAERNDGMFDQAVAIKFIRPKSGRISLAPYMDAERRLLARMSHPGIARILDGGTTDNGLLYLVMELVDGESLDRYFETQHASLFERVDLIRTMCDAVAHAHQNLVLHCDIKPANILVTAEGAPKLIDFGVARGQGLVDSRAQGFTQAYTSPQRLVGEPVVTADDIYSLGVVLRDAVSDAPTASSAPPADLQAIIASATAIERDARYATVDALSGDLSRWLAGQPVLAMLTKGSEWRYVASKFVKRHPWRVLSAAIAGISLIAALVTISLLYARADLARHEAEQRFGEVRSLANFVLFDLDTALESIPGTTRVRRDLIGRGQQYLDVLASAAMTDQSLRGEVARGLTRLGEVQGVPGRAHVGEPAAAKLSLERAESMLVGLSTSSPDDWSLQRDLGRARYLLAIAYGGIDNDIKRQLEKAKQAEGHILAALRTIRSKPPATADVADVELLLLGARLVQADALKYNNDHKAAAAIQAAEEERMKNLPEAVKQAMPFDYQSARPTMMLGDSYWYLKEFEKATQAYQRATAQMESGLKRTPNDRRLLNGALQGYWNLSSALLDTGASATDALAIIDKGVVVGERLMSMDPDNVEAQRAYGVVVNQRALILSKLYRHAEALELVKGRLAGSEARLAKNPDDAERARDPVVVLRMLAEIYADAGDTVKACQTWRRADEGWRALGQRWKIAALDESSDVAVVREKLAGCGR